MPSFLGAKKKKSLKDTDKKKEKKQYFVTMRLGERQEATGGNLQSQINPTQHRYLNICSLTNYKQ